MLRKAELPSDYWNKDFICLFYYSAVFEGSTDYIALYTDR